MKLDRGGIRDIEFLVQCLQRVYGGTEPWLRSGGTLFALQKLHDKEHLSGTDFHKLTAPTSSCARSSTGCNCATANRPIACPAQ